MSWSENPSTDDDGNDLIYLTHPDLGDIEIYIDPQPHDLETWVSVQHTDDDLEALRSLYSKLSGCDPDEIVDLELIDVPAQIIFTVYGVEQGPENDDLTDLLTASLL